jgi:ketosteroid isomerase-like protein
MSAGTRSPAEARRSPAAMTRETLQEYFDALARKEGWESFLAEDMVFTSFVSPAKEVRGKGPYLEVTRRFYGSIASMQLRDLIVEGPKACALTRYELRAPTGNTFTSDVAELFTVGNGKIDSFAIYFDPTPFPK